MNEVIVFADPESLLTVWLRGRDLELDDGISVSVDVDAPSLSLAATERFVQLELAGTPTKIRMLEQATVRYVAWAPKGRRGDVKALCARVGGELLAHPGDGDIFAVSPLVGRSPIVTDPDTKNLSCWGTVRVSLRPHQVTP